jgi:hypothetical protein
MHGLPPPLLALCQHIFHLESQRQQVTNPSRYTPPCGGLCAVKIRGRSNVFHLRSYFQGWV